MKRSTFLLLLCAILTSAPLQAVNPQDWMKKMNKARPRKVTQKYTSVAAVRGVDEPSDVDPAARDFGGVSKMEAKTYPPAQVEQFGRQGKLNRVNVKAGGKP